MICCIWSMLQHLVFWLFFNTLLTKGIKVNAGIWVIPRLCRALWSRPRERKQTSKPVSYPWRLLYNPRLSFWSHWNDWYQRLDLMYNEVYSVGVYRVVLEKVKRTQISLCTATNMPVRHMTKLCFLYTSDGQLHDKWKRRQIFVMSCCCFVGKL